jgi:hypothetical protein
MAEITTEYAHVFTNFQTLHVRWPGKTSGPLRRIDLEFSFVTFLYFKTKKVKGPASRQKEHKILCTFFCLCKRKYQTRPNVPFGTGGEKHIGNDLRPLPSR